MGSDPVLAIEVVLDENALLIAAVHVSGGEVQLVADYGEVAYPGYLTVAAINPRPAFPASRGQSP